VLIVKRSLQIVWREVLGFLISHIFAQHLYESAEREITDQIFGLSNLFSNQFGAKAKGKFEDLNMKKFGNQKMP
jgi:hypothetical protein